MKNTGPHRACLAALLVLALLAAPGFAQACPGEDISASGKGDPDYAFRDQDGGHRRLRDFHGKVTLLFFGFLNCPNYCPMTLGKLNEVMEQLGEAAGRVQVAYVTLDPERDTPERLKNYVRAFHPDFVGLFTAPEQTAHMARIFGIYSARVKGRTPASYAIDHSTGIYAYDPNGRLRLELDEGMSAGQIAAAIRCLLSTPTDAQK